MKLTRINVLLLLLLFCMACNSYTEESANKEIAFDEQKWKEKKDRDYPYRHAMLDDLIASKKLKGIAKREVMNLLGQPDRTDSSYLFYRVSQKRLGFWPLHTTTLVIKMAGSDSVEWVKIHQ